MSALSLRTTWLAALLLTPLWACTARPGSWSVPSNWAQLAPSEFETLALSTLPDGIRVRPTDDTLGILASALSTQDQVSVRAAILLGRTGSERAAEVLLARLERRVLGPERASDAGDFIAAAALAALPLPEEAASRLVALVLGEEPHPDFEVRVEAGARALDAGRDEVIPFLLVVLRIGTRAGLQDERDFPPSPTTAWARGRAALALSRRAGVANTYNPDAPLSLRQSEAQKLARALQSE